MANLATWRLGATALAAGLLVAACGGGGGGRGPVDTSAVGGPQSGAGSTATSSAHASRTHAKGGAKSSGSHAPGHGSSTAAGRSSTTHSGGGGGGGGTGGGGGGGTGGGGTGGGGGGLPSNCTQSNSAGAHIVVCPGKSLQDGQTVTITGDHFKPNEGLLYMECDYKGESSGNYGPSDCNINLVAVLAGRANSTKSDANGKVGPLHLALKTQFKRINCATQQCMVTVAVPIQKDNADNPHALIYFG
jgi:hypothetical protein